MNYEKNTRAGKRAAQRLPTTILAAFCGALAALCFQGQIPVADAPPNPKIALPMPNSSAPLQNGPTKTQKKRKARSEAYLKSKGVKLNKGLPCVSDAGDFRARTPEEVIGRAYALLIVALKGEGLEQVLLDSIIEARQIDSFSPQERRWLVPDELEGRDKANATRRYESLYVMLWALGHIDTLKYPSEICNAEKLVETIYYPSRADFEAAAKLRSKEELLDELDKVYRMHWATVQARLDGEAPSGSLYPSVVFERHYALNWLTRYRDQPWDKITTDT